MVITETTIYDPTIRYKILLLQNSLYVSSFTSIVVQSSNTSVSATMSLDGILTIKNNAEPCTFMNIRIDII